MWVVITESGGQRWQILTPPSGERPGMPPNIVERPGPLPGTKTCQTPHINEAALEKPLT